mmetsp:Transcript_25068/g.41964  ORF Transcript_25068/g.41964 Transcript_25068/m.41964 type:complete len:394 (-) Transcript_25068:651-1832(-)
MWVPFEEIEDKLTPMMNVNEVDNANQLRMFVVDEIGGLISRSKHFTQSLMTLMNSANVMVYGSLPAEVFGQELDFVKGIKNRLDTTLVTLTRTNRELVAARILTLVQDLFQQHMRTFPPIFQGRVVMTSVTDLPDGHVIGVPSAESAMWVRDASGMWVLRDGSGGSQESAVIGSGSGSGGSGQGGSGQNNNINNDNNNNNNQLAPSSVIPHSSQQHHTYANINHFQGTPSANANINHFHQPTTPSSTAPSNFQHPMFTNMLNNVNMLTVNPPYSAAANNFMATTTPSAAPNNFQHPIVANMMLYQSESPPNQGWSDPRQLPVSDPVSNAVNGQSPGGSQYSQLTDSGPVSGPVSGAVSSHAPVRSQLADPVALFAAPHLVFPPNWLQLWEHRG